MKCKQRFVEMALRALTSSYAHTFRVGNFIFMNLSNLFHIFFLIAFSFAAIDTIMSFYNDDNWDEEEEDRRLLEESQRNLDNEDSRLRRSRSRSPLRRGVRSSVSVPDSALDAHIEQVLESKLDGFLGKVKDVVSGAQQSQQPRTTDVGLSGQMEALQLTQKELKRQQLASSMKTDGGRFQYLALSGMSITMWFTSCPPKTY